VLFRLFALKLDSHSEKYEKLMLLSKLIFKPVNNLRLDFIRYINITI